MRIARRPIAPHAICCAVACAHVAIGTIDRTRCGNVIAHSSTCMPPIDPPMTECQTAIAEVIGQSRLRAHHVADRDDREPAAVRLAVDRVRRRRPGRALAATEHVGAHDEPPVGVDRQPGPDRALPPAGGRVTVPGRAGGVAVAGPRVAQQDGVAWLVVERSPRLVGDDDVVERDAAVERERARSNVEELAMAHGVAGTPRTARRAWLARHLVLLLALVSVSGRRTREAELPCDAGPHPRRSGMAPWGFLPGCRIVGVGKPTITRDANLSETLAIARAVHVFNSATRLTRATDSTESRDQNG